MNLKISTELSLPREAVTQTFAILAKRGSGKTYTGAVMAEEMLKAGLQVVIIDPVGVWWGLRAAANGKDEGLPIVVMGGDHGDLPLEEDAGELVADVVVDELRSVVLDLSGMRKAEQVRFITPFLETLYRRNRSPLHLMVDEADAFAPQRSMPNEKQVLGAMEDIVRRGRAHGLGCTLITQRPAVLNKNVLTQIEVLVCLRMIAPQDRAAVESWVEVHGTQEQCEELLDSLPSLDIGTGWFWSPGWLNIFQRVKIRKRETFDSSSTPKVGEVAIAPRKMKPIDLEGLRTKMAALIQEATENDPETLKREIVGLKRDLAKATKGDSQTTKPDIREVPVILEEDLDRVSKLGGMVGAVMTQIRDLGQQLCEAQRQVAVRIENANVQWRNATVGLGVAKVERPHANMQKDLHIRTAPAPAVAKNGSSSLQPRHQAILDALASFEGMGLKDVHKDQLAIFCEKSPKSSAWANDLGSLRSQGLIDYPAGGRVALGDAGRKLAVARVTFRSLDDLHEAWYRKLQPRHADIVKSLVEIYPEWTSKETLAQRVGKSASSSAFANDLGSLRSLGIIAYPVPGHVGATDLLFPPL